MSELEEFRKRKDEFFGTGRESPIPAAEQAAFSGLKYFPENPNLRFLVSPEKVPPEDVSFTTSTGEQKTYKKIGKLKFSVAEQPAELILYQAESGTFFLPFRDATSGSETYGAGRYLEVKKVEEDGPPKADQPRAEKFELDFNYAYNPYCAYSPHYSCPLPPPENWLKVPIRAGEKKFHQ